MATKKSVRDLVTWALTQKPGWGAGLCPTCKHPQARRVAAAVCEARQKGHPSSSQNELFKELQESYPDFAEKVSWLSFREHLRKHTVGWNGKL